MFHLTTAERARQATTTIVEKLLKCLTPGTKPDILVSKYRAAVVAVDHLGIIGSTVLMDGVADPDLVLR